MTLPRVDWRKAIVWSRANWMWIVAWIVLPTFVVLALMAWHRQKQKKQDTPETKPTNENSEPEPITEPENVEMRP